MVHTHTPTHPQTPLSLFMAAVVFTLISCWRGTQPLAPVLRSPRISFRIALHFGPLFLNLSTLKGVHRSPRSKSLEISRSFQTYSSCRATTSSSLPSSPLPTSSHTLLLTCFRPALRCRHYTPSSRSRPYSQCYILCSCRHSSFFFVLPIRSHHHSAPLASSICLCHKPDDRVERREC